MKNIYILFLLLFCSTSAYSKKANAIWYFLEKTQSSITENNDISIVYGIYTKYANVAQGKNPCGGEAPFPTMRIMVTNKTDKIIHVDLGTSFLKKNNVASVIYTPTITSTMVGTSVGSSVNLGSVANAFGIGGFAGTIMGGVTIGGSVSTATTTSTYAQRFVSIPPKSSVFLEDIPILTPGSEKALGDIFYYREVGMGKYKWTACLSPKFDDIESGKNYDFTEENAPFKIGGFINYSFDNDFKESFNLETTYYVKKIVGSSWGYKMGAVSDKEFKIMDETFPGWRKHIESGTLEVIRLWAK